MERQLTGDFVVELLKAILTSSKVLEVCKKHLKYQYLLTEAQKKVLKFIFDTTSVTNKVPTIGIIGQTYSTDDEVILLLTKIKKITIEKEQIENILDTLEAYIIESRFRILYEKLGDLYNEGKKKEAFKLLTTESKEINEFHLKDSFYTTVFKDFGTRQEQRVNNKDSILLEKLTFGIHELDDLTRGGQNKGTSSLFLARSGIGKSTYLRWMGLCNARLGRRVVHFQGEGTEKECLDAYDAGWTSIDLHDIEFGTIPESKKLKIQKAQRDILSNGGEIYVYASESFDSMSLNDCRDIMTDITTLHGQIDLAIFDYLEIFTVKGQYGNSEASERKRREDIANKITNIATEFKCATATAAQAQDILPEKYNNPDFVLKRSHISEFKGMLKPFSYFFTFNNTDDEYQSEIIRIYVDKLRKYKSGQTIKIYQSRSNGRFYDSVKTLKEFYRK